MRSDVRRRFGLAGGGTAAGAAPHRRACTLMWSAIGGAALLFAVLLALGWSRDGALGTAAGALFLACIAACVWAWITQERMWKRALHDLSSQRAGPVSQRRQRSHGQGVFGETAQASGPALCVMRPAGQPGARQCRA